MKKAFIIILTLVLIGCVNNQKKENNRDGSSITDTLLESTNGSEAESETVLTNCSLVFGEFFEKFSKDSLFQKNRVKYPLKTSYIEDIETGNLTTKLISNAREYNYIDFTKDKSAMDKESDKYSIDIENLEEIVYYKLLGYDNGIHISYKFELIDGCWLLIEILDEST